MKLFGMIGICIAIVLDIIYIVMRHYWKKRLNFTIEGLLEFFEFTKELIQKEHVEFSEIRRFFDSEDVNELVPAEEQKLMFVYIGGMVVLFFDNSKNLRMMLYNCSLLMQEIVMAKEIFWGTLVPKEIMETFQNKIDFLERQMYIFQEEVERLPPNIV